MSANPIGLVIAAVLALVAAFVILWNKSETFREFWKGLWEKIKEVAGVVLEAITGFFSAAWDKIKEVWSVVTEFFLGVWNGIKAVFSTVIGFYKNIFTGAFNGVKAIWNKAKGFFQGIWLGIRKVFASVASWFGARFREAWNAIKRPFAAVGSFFGGIWSTIKSKFQDIGQRLGDTIGGAFKKAINAVLRTVENVINAPVRAINGLIGIINDLGFGFGYLNEISLPRLAKGGVLKKGQVGLLEGDGAEAVVPLEQNTKWIRRVADEMRLSLANGQGNTLSNNTGSFNGDQITVNVYGSQGMDVNTLAIAVEQRLARVQRQKQEVWA
jgi:phage-related minor tail protein